LAPKPFSTSTRISDGETVAASPGLGGAEVAEGGGVVLVPDKPVVEVVVGGDVVEVVDVPSPAAFAGVGGEDGTEEE